MVWLPEADGEKALMIYLAVSTEYGIVRAMHTRRAVKSIRMVKL